MRTFPNASYLVAGNGVKKRCNYEELTYRNTGSLNLLCFLDDKDAIIAEVQSCFHLVSSHFSPGSLLDAFQKAGQ